MSTSSSSPLSMSDPSGLGCSSPPTCSAAFEAGTSMPMSKSASSGGCDIRAWKGRPTSACYNGLLSVKALRQLQRCMKAREEYRIDKSEGAPVFHEEL